MALMVSATEEGVGRTKSVCLQLVSIAIISVQLMVLYTIMWESSSSRCMEHADCKAGEFCGSSWLYHRTSPGACMDCLYALENRETSGFFDFSGMSGELWTESIKYCNATDVFPTRCDHLVHNCDILSGAGVLVLGFSAVIALIPAIQDLDQCNDEQLVMIARHGLSPLFYVSHRLRFYLVPLFVVGATAALILSNAFTSQDFLLNGLAIGFASSIDDMLSFFFVTKARRERIEGVVETALDQQERVAGWKRNRLYGITLALTLFVTVLFCEDLIQIFGDDSRRVYQEDGVRRTSCADILDVTWEFPGCLIYFVALLMSVFNERNTTWWKVAQDALMTLLIKVLGFMIIFVVVAYLHVGVD